MNLEQFAEGSFINAELIDASPTKIITITGDCKIVEGKFGQNPEFPCDLDSKPKTLNPGRDLLKNLRAAVGSWDSKQLIARQFKLGTTIVNGKKRVIFEKLVK